MASLSQHRALKQALLRIPAHDLSVQAIHRCVDRYAAPEGAPGLLTSLDAVCLDTVIGKHRRADLASPLLDWACTRAAERGARPVQLLFNAAIRGLAYSSSPSAYSSAEHVMRRMASGGARVSAYTLQGLFRTARGSDRDPVPLLMGVLQRSSARPNVAALNALFATQAYNLRMRSREEHGAEPPSKVAEPSLPLLRKVLQAIGLSPNMATVLEVHPCAM